LTGWGEEFLDPRPHRLDQDLGLENLRCEEDLTGSAGAEDLLDLQDLLLRPVPELQDEQIGRTRIPRPVCGKALF